MAHVVSATGFVALAQPIAEMADPTGQLAIQRGSNLSPDLLELRLDELSERMKLVRELKGLTLAQLSAKSAVSPSTILKIESRQMVPSVAVMMKIATGLNVGLADLIAPTSFEMLDIHAQSAGTHGRLQTSSEFYYEQLSSPKLKSDLHFWRVRINGGGSIVFPRPQPFEEQVALCEVGKIEMGLDEEKYILNEGDSIHVLKRTLTSIRNLRHTPSSYLATGTLPKFPSFEAMVRSQG